MRIPFLTTSKRIVRMDGTAVVETDDQTEAMTLLDQFRRTNPNVTIRRFDYSKPECWSYRTDHCGKKRLIIHWSASIDLTPEKE